MSRRAQAAARWRGAAILGVLGILCSTSVAGVAWGKDHDNAPPPSLRIAVEPLGYRPPGKLYLLAHYSSASLDFLDANHLLFTFREPRLLRRSARSIGLDQAVRAQVLELPGGALIQERHWMLEDRQRYVWRVGHDKALLRIGDRLFETDSDLNLKPFLHAETPLREVDASPDGRMLVVETETERHTAEEHARLAKRAEEVGADPPQEDVQISMLALEQFELKLKARAEQPGRLPAMTGGFLTNEKLLENRWNVRFHSFGRKEAGSDIVAQLDSTCPPEEHFLTDEMLLAISCPPRHGDRYVAAYSLRGQKLWDGRWPANFLWPAFRISPNGATVAISWIALGHPASEFDGFDDNEVQAQVLSVLDSKTGALRMALRLEPIISAGGNFALSPDGSRLAVLNHGAIEVYDLPVVAAAETARK